MKLLKSILALIIYFNNHLSCVVFINKQKKFNVSDIDKTLNVFLKAMRKSFAEIITVLTQTC